MDKRKKIICIFLITIFCLISIAATVSAAIECDSTQNINNIYEDIISFHFDDKSVDSIQEWINESLIEEIGINGEWYVISLSQKGKYDFSVFENKLLEYIDENNISSASTRLKLALTLAACGSDSSKIEELLNNSMGKQGIMSLVYGIHLLNNGYCHEEYDINSAITELLSMQNSDGGWALYGDKSDVDVTAMCLQALAPFCGEYVFEIDLALKFLSEKQLSDGDYISYGVSNPESGSQVIIALSSLKIDFFNDDRFIKNDNNLLDGIYKYRLPNGSFSHIQKGEYNVNSTVQVFSAMVAYMRLKAEKSGIYILDSHESDEIESESIVESVEDKQETYSDENEQKSENSDLSETADNKEKDVITIKINYIFCIIILILFLTIVIIMLALKRFNKTNFLVLLILTVVLICIVLMLDIKSTEEYYNGESISKNAYGKIIMSINCESIVDMSSDNSFIPEDGVILPKTEMYIADGETAFDILIEASRRYSIQVENNGTEKSAYIAGINYIYEFDFGNTSGWVFLINGEHASVGSSSYVLQDGDEVEWRYVLEPWENLK